MDAPVFFASPAQRLLMGELARRAGLDEADFVAKFVSVPEPPRPIYSGKHLVVEADAEIAPGHVAIVPPDHANPVTTFVRVPMAGGAD